MAKTLTVKLKTPKKIPHTTTIFIPEGIINIIPAKNFQDNQELNFIAGLFKENAQPTERKITFSYKEELSARLKDQYFYAGQIRPQRIKGENKIIHIFIEK